ncbi:class I SAM-dependent methyltransferase [Azospirillum halopraeferens]|uniref:class I SAM-dependent methyltransferase n=1 Tax=Azospirillum halopraeferens TaxID=34010 RepID=UPI000401F743|nr:methyltransferase domain-containing protein [Azospirillum halopraeferens]
MRINLGCGFDKRDGFVNVDKFTACEPDVLMDIESPPWPFDSDCVDYILAKHVLEHVGRTAEDLGAILREVYRICKPGGRFEVHVPHHRHDTFHSDPTHVRPFTRLTFEMMSRKRNEEWIRARANYTMLALMYGIDFEIEDASQEYDAHWVRKLQAGEVTREQLRDLALTQNNIIREIRVVLRAVK